MRVLLMCDQKWRDLPNLVVTKAQLNWLGHQTFIVSTKEAIPLLSLLRPNCIVFNHLNGKRYRRYARAFRDAGIATVLMPTEGLPHPIAMPLVCGEFTDFSLVDLYLSWNDEVTRGIQARGDAAPKDVVTVGCGRTDFYREPLCRTISSREEQCRNLRLDPARPIVTWATQYNFADYHDVEGPSWDKFINEATDLGGKPCLDRIGLPFRDIPAEQHAARAAAACAFQELVRALPQVQFLIKPHPAEQPQFYRSLVDRLVEMGASVRLCKSTYIWEVLNATDVLLHRQCTTAVKSWILNRPTVEMAMRREPGYEWPEREAGSEVAESAEALVTTVARLLNERGITRERAAIRAAYLEKWFHRIDGRRCNAIAATIDTFLMKCRRVPRKPVKLPELPPPSSRAVAALRYALSVPPSSRVRDVIRPTAASRAAADRWATWKDVVRYERRLKSILARS